MMDSVKMVNSDNFRDWLLKNVPSISFGVWLFRRFACAI